jgi:hypothetical protein
MLYSKSCREKFEKVRQIQTDREGSFWTNAGSDDELKIKGLSFPGLLFEISNNHDQWSFQINTSVLRSLICDPVNTWEPN